ncbi:MAG: peptide chain release factor N(5)-glutamine methyltransferase [Candidatus Limnocylindria bacterium]
MSSSSSALTVGEAIAAGVAKLRASGSPSARLDAELLIAHVDGHDRSWILAHPEAPLGEAAAFAAALERRAAGEPIAYIRGYKEWHSLRIRTDRRALIPRPETELLADEAIAAIARRGSRRAAPLIVWEVATGSGAVAVALAIHFRADLAADRMRLIASDVAPEALELAAENFAAHAVAADVALFRADLLEPAEGSLPRPDVIVANLPYVPSSGLADRHGSLAFEPPLALDGGRDGLGVLRRLMDQLPARAAPGASVLLEIGADQGDAVMTLAPAGASASLIRDLAGLDRVVRVEMPD